MREVYFQPAFDLGLPEIEMEDGSNTFDIINRAPDAIWGTDNDFGIPLLDVNLQALSVDLPFSCWGATKRKIRMPGTWHFYTQDYRFEKLWKNPEDVVNTHCINIVEPNWSCYDQMPNVIYLWQIYRKRWMARWWQSFGVRVFVDLNVAERAYDYNLSGVPRGWKAWATRGYSERLDNIKMEYDLACAHAETSSILFIVYGGGKMIRELCKKYNWIWFDEQENWRGGKNG